MRERFYDDGVIYWPGALTNESLQLAREANQWSLDHPGHWAGDKPGFQSLQNVNSHNVSTYPTTKRQFDGWRPIAQKPNGEIDTEYTDVVIPTSRPPEYDDVVYTFNIQTGLTDVWDDINFYDRNVNKFHSTQKPIPLIERIIKTSSNKGQSVLDIFGGSGSTGVACQMHNREFIGCEIDKNYYNQSYQRIISTEPVEEVSQDRFNPLLDAL